MPLRRHCQQLIKFERGRIIGLREGGFSFRDIPEHLAGTHPLFMIVESSGQERNKVTIRHLRARCPVVCIPLTPSHCRVSGVKQLLIGVWNGDVMCFLMQAGSAMMLVKYLCYSGGQWNTCNQIDCSLDKPDLHPESWSGKKFPMPAGALSWLS
ncbi:HTH_Tnp_Tc3_2 domain-containing protein [Trichonephila clavipes]|nr:HTH_Tnp_Tc3_2 domain-containing protein [Trichonephila clavipes]